MINPFSGILLLIEHRDVGRMIQLLVVYKKLLIWKRYNIKKYQDYCVAFNFYFLGNPVFASSLNHVGRRSSFGGFTWSGGHDSLLCESQFSLLIGGLAS
ncbi:hypothetical protein [Caldibacillus thermoamylovorans]|uniref:hypothetical protein n=1 Tax=Caldibacillus thermoamylovorans TaxID=35841 RepID=UPI0022E987AB|nr:hypothetical protein [Caldibacillus thermoamylovorans]